VNYIGNSEHKKPKRAQMPDFFLIKELGFNDSQLEEFKRKSPGHHETMIQYSKDIKDLKNLLFNRLTDKVDSNLSIDSITSLIGEKEKQKQEEVFQHFKMIESICKETQKETFKTILKDALRHKTNERSFRNKRKELQRRTPPRDF
tara:strand:+ start:2999 stop:3436 length:438 start_codon:yes stop_codon:yes gene_type:complete